MNKAFTTLLLAFALISIACCKSAVADVEKQEENVEAKRMLQGVWLNSDDETVTMMAKGDTIFYADSTSQPVAFSIIGDSLILHSSKEMRYAIVKQTENIFQFRNSTGDAVKLIKSHDPLDKSIFDNRPRVEMSLNQRQLIKRDSIMTGADKSYHVYTQVNPTTYRVVRTVYNQDGVGVDNVYYDNFVHLRIFQGARCVFRKDFKKNDFENIVPSGYVSEAILSDILCDHVDEAGIHVNAMLCVPDSPTQYIVHVTVSHEGKVTMAL